MHGDHAPPELRVFEVAAEEIQRLRDQLDRIGRLGHGYLAHGNG